MTPDTSVAWRVARSTIGDPGRDAMMMAAPSLTSASSVERNAA
ncbi:MAG TPA: hypothetical protein VFK39_04645 [Gemmatimonadaceae bacterium]|nr:hypothetical protein [Gemmatimonadaceae bacterium]